MMTFYDPNTPQPNDLHSDSQDDFLNNFTLWNQYFGVDHIPDAYVITGLKSLSPTSPGLTQVTCTSYPQGLTSSNAITFDNVIGFTGINGITANFNAEIDANNFTVSFNSSGFPAYESSGTFTVSGYTPGFHQKTSFSFPRESVIRASTLFSKMETNGLRLFYQNIIGNAFRLTGVDVISADSGGKKTTMGFKSPWGITFNFGQVTFNGFNPQTYTFAIPFTTQIYTIIAQPVTIGILGNTIAVNNVTNSSFEGITLVGAQLQSNPIAVYFLAIGK